MQEIWSEAFDGVVISTEEDKSLVDGKYQKQLQNAQVFSVLVSPEFRRESGIWTSGGKDKPLSWDGIREYSVENGFGLAAWQDLTTKPSCPKL